MNRGIGLEWHGQRQPGQELDLAGIPAAPVNCPGTLCWTNRRFVQQWWCHGKDVIEQVGDTSPEIRTGHRETDARWPDEPFGRKQGALRGGHGSSEAGRPSARQGRPIGGGVSQVLVRQAKRQTGIEADTDLIEFALATVALADNFAQAFRKSRGKVDPALKLGF